MLGTLAADGALLQGASAVLASPATAPGPSAGNAVCGVASVSTSQPSPESARSHDDGSRDDGLHRLLAARCVADAVAAVLSSRQRGPVAPNAIAWPDADVATMGLCSWLAGSGDDVCMAAGHRLAAAVSGLAA